MPVETGIQTQVAPPRIFSNSHSRAGGNPETNRTDLPDWIPACAGMTIK